MDNENGRRKFLKYGFIGITAFAAAIAPFKLQVNDTFSLKNGNQKISLEDATASAACGANLDCSGGGGQCGANLNCSGGGGQCGANLNCSGS